MAWFEKKQMTVGDMIEKLSKLDRNLPVVEEVYDPEWNAVEYLPVYDVEVRDETVVLSNNSTEWKEEETK